MRARVGVATGCVGIVCEAASCRNKTQYEAPRAPERTPIEGEVEGSFPHPSLKGQNEGRGAYDVIRFHVSKWYVSQVNLFYNSYT